MKVLMANKFFHLNGGSEKVFFQERELLQKKGIAVIDFSMQDQRNLYSPYAEFFVGNINYESPGGLSRKLKTALSFIHSGEAVKKLEKLLERERPDVAHLHNIYHQLTPSIIRVLKKHGVKTVLTLHDYKLICPSYLALNKGRICTVCDGRAFWKALTCHCQGSRMQELLLAGEGLWHRWQRSYEAVDIFIAPSRFLVDLTSRRIPRRKISLLRNGINLDNYSAYYADKGYALYLGRLSKEKGIRTLLEAHNKLNSAIPLKVAGTGPLEASLQSVYPDVQFTGYKTGTELNDLIKEAAFVVVPSECYENCSMSVLEAMASGKAVIGSNLGGLPEQIEDGASGLLFEPGNAHDLAEKMARLMQDKVLRQDMGRAGRKIIEEKFSLHEHGNKLISIYRQLSNES
jgi:glycosyltransferase involved in cell wall biosynthesis